ncbi:DsrE family protein [Planctomyces sp. SH-PL62]|uniref:DsrE family protein n=1 Tax=Planctomyces sp. SH-PL62 TaxID=1636152 RepID=UPI00078BBE5B|nr:DsrE family protein [Planctomyces sp. SH-PL62]AMV40217.1 DsrE/DsrF-like family protein [Planctomyces sp. SH-PL62]
MKTRTLLAILATSCLWFHEESPTARDDGPSDPLKVVVHVNVPDSGVQGAGLKNVTNILKEAPDTQVEVVCHGAGIGLVEKARTDHAEAVEALVKKGVKFVACENTMRLKSIKKEDLLPGVVTVPSGAVEVVHKQQKDGYAYFKP